MNENYNKSDFYAHKFYTYNGANYYLNRQALVFNLFLEPDGPNVEYYKNDVIKKFPELKNEYPDKVVDLYTEVCSIVLKMDIQLLIGEYNINYDNDEYIIALEYFDEHVTREVIFFVSDWFNALNAKNKSFDFDAKFKSIQLQFDQSIYGNPTLYALIESGIKRGVHVKYLYEENQFQWGYGKKQQRGSSTIFHSDGIKDIEFSTYKDMVGDFLEMMRFPAPRGKCCFSKNEIIEEANRLGFPVVVKPVTGFKGQNVTVNIESDDEVHKAFDDIINSEYAEEDFEGVLVQKQIYGNDYRILTIGGKYAACLKKIPAYVIGNGIKSIKELIEIENTKEVRADNTKSPLTKIYVDKQMIEFLHLQGWTLDSVPKENEKIVFQREASISKGAISENVTNEMHIDNIDLIESIAAYFTFTIMGIDIMSIDLSKSWKEGDFGILSIKAGPGIFMHLSPAIGESINIPGKIINYFFGKNSSYDRIPIIAGNNVSDSLITLIYNKLKGFKKDLFFGSLHKKGVSINNIFLTNNSDHDKNCEIILRHPKLDFALFNHNNDDILEFGHMHHGLDLLIIEDPLYAEMILKRDLLPNGICIEINSDNNDENVVGISLTQNGNTVNKIFSTRDDKDEKIFNLLEPLLEELLHKYDFIDNN